MTDENLQTLKASENESDITTVLHGNSVFLIAMKNNFHLT